MVDLVCNFTNVEKRELVKEWVITGKVHSINDHQQIVFQLNQDEIQFQSARLA